MRLATSCLADHFLFLLGFVAVKAGGHGQIMKNIRALRNRIVLVALLILGGVPARAQTVSCKIATGAQSMAPLACWFIGVAMSE